MSLVSRAHAALAILVLVLLSCSSHDPIRVRFDDSVSEASRARAWGEMRSLNDVTADYDDVKFVVDPRGDELFSMPPRILLSNGKEMDGRECTDEGKDCERGKWVRVRAGLDPERERNVMRHELAHVLDMHHVDAVATMHPSDTASYLTPADMTECIEAGACGSITTRAAAVAATDERPWFKRAFGKPRRRRPPHVELESDRECY